VHLFEPHAPYGNPADPVEAQRPVAVRYDEEIAEADRQAGRLVDALGDARKDTLIVAAADHGEAFGEHGEISHSVFTYDTTLRVPMIVSGPGVSGARVVSDSVALIDVAPTIAARTGLGRFDSDGIDLSPALTGGSLTARTLYAESFAPLLDFGWSPLRTLRDGHWKYISAPKPELYDLQKDPGETQNLVATEATRASELARRTDAISSATLASNGAALDREARARLQRLPNICRASMLTSASRAVRWPQASVQKPSAYFAQPSRSNPAIPSSSQISAWRCQTAAVLPMD
jgi:arylsulfatase A-like enzyme